ncbi:Hypothetical predicted protein [Olea europaea subsp. europaea]|uniref:Uncharacterized protein n=1 Tax=Olea europaea subsp. europaea TaxID=158383 RepID=A0A8S0SBB0_OLEEU|nr:Hypothetical predicted protein [Olea europaea subsp. europaea]
MAPKKTQQKIKLTQCMMIYVMKFKEPMYDFLSLTIEERKLRLDAQFAKARNQLEEGIVRTSFPEPADPQYAPNV